MKINICDCCKKPTDLRISVVSGTQIDFHSANTETVEKSYDLCEKCQLKILSRYIIYLEKELGIPYDSTKKFEIIEGFLLNNIRYPG